MSRVAMQMALWALENVDEMVLEGGDVIFVRDEIAALREALAAEPEQEPVENRFVGELREHAKTNPSAYLFPRWDVQRALKYLTGYTAPQPAQSAKPLTDEQIDQEANCIFTDDPVRWWRELARAIEAAHGIKEQP